MTRKSKWNSNKKIVNNYILNNIDMIIDNKINIYDNFIINLCNLMNNLNDFKDEHTDLLGTLLFLINPENGYFSPNNFCNIGKIKKSIENKKIDHIFFTDTLEDIKHRIANMEQDKSNGFLQIHNDDVFKSDIFLENAYESYAFMEKKENLFLDNSGTGSGKTYNNLHNFIKWSSSKKDNFNITNYIMMAPQKNMFNLKSLVKDAIEAGLFVGQIKSRKDLLEPDSKNYCTIYNEMDTTKKFLLKITKNFNRLKENEEGNLIIEKNKKHYHLYKKIREEKNSYRNNENEEDYYQDFINNQNTAIYLHNNLTTLYHEYEIAIKTNNDDEVQETILKKIENNITNAFLYLFQGIFMTIENNIFIEDTHIIREYLLETKGIKKDIIDFMVFFSPLTMSQYKKSVIFTTVDKAIASGRMWFINSKGIKYLSSNLFTILSGKKEQDKVIDSKHLYLNYLTDEQKYKEIKKSLEFSKNPIFIQKNIRFQIFIDEEHKSHSIIMTKNITSLAKGVNILDALVVTLRQVMTFANDESIQDYEWEGFDGINNNPNTQRHNIYRRCQIRLAYLFPRLCKRFISSINTFDDLKYYYDNLITEGFSGIVVEMSEKDVIDNLLSNIVYMNPKNIINLEVLKSIYLEIGQYKNYFPLTTNKEEGKNYIDLYTLISMIMCMFTACAEIPKNKYNILTNNKIEHQDDSLISIIGQSIKNKDFIQDIMNNTQSEDHKIYTNILFVYFAKKIIFEFSPQKIKNKNSYIDINNKSYYLLNININIMKRPPEIDILRMLYKTNNKIILASATRGFDNIYYGGFDIPFLEDVSETIESIEHEPLIEVKSVCDENAEDLTYKRIAYKYDFNNNIYIGDMAISSKNENYTYTSKKYTAHNIDLFNDSGLSYNANEINMQLDTITIEVQHNSFLEKVKNVLSAINIPSNLFRKKERKIFTELALRSIYKNRSALIMSLSNCFSDNIFLDNDTSQFLLYFNKKQQKWNHKDSYLAHNKWIVEYKRQIEDLQIDNRHKVIIFISKDEQNIVKIIFFDSKLGQDPALDNIMNIDGSNTNIIMSASYASAGTGLNLINSVKNDKISKLDRNLKNYIEKDFNDIYFISFPHWNKLRTDTAGFHSSENVYPLLKFLYHNQPYEEAYDLSFFDEGMNSRKIIEIIEREYHYENIKDIMQAAGRIERRNNRDERNIYFFVDKNRNNFKRYAEVFYNFIRDSSKNIEYNHNLSKGFSPNGRMLMKIPNHIITQSSLTLEEKDDINEQYYEYKNIVDNFFEPINGHISFYRKALIGYRNNDPEYNWFYVFNKHLRNITSTKMLFENEENLQHIFFYNVEHSYKDFIEECATKNIDIPIKEGQIIKKLFLSMFFFIPKDIQEKHIALKNGQITDIKESSYTLNDADIYGFSLPGDYKIDTSNKYEYDIIYRMNKHNDHLKSDSITCIPVGQMMQNIKGNIAEKVVYEVLQYLCAKNKFILFDNELSSEFTPQQRRQSYELFDYALFDPISKRIFFIDVKNMTDSNDNNIRYIEERSGDKISKLFDIFQPENNKYECNYLYLNIKTGIDFSNEKEKYICKNHTDIKIKNKIKYCHLFDLIFIDKSDASESKELRLSKSFMEIVKNFFNTKAKNKAESLIIKNMSQGDKL